MPESFCVALDFETAGYYGHSACAIGLAKIENFRVVDQYYSLIKPPSSRIYFSHVHGLKWKDLKNERPFEKVWPEALEFIGGARYLLAHNARFDRGVLAACCEVFAQAYPAQPFLCTLKGARRALPLPSKSLGSVCEYFNIGLEHHHAASDARACALVYAELKKLGLGDEQMLI